MIHDPSRICESHKHVFFILRAFKPPVDVNNKNNMVGVLIDNLIKEENIATQRSPLNNASLPKSNKPLARPTTQIRTTAFSWT